MLLDATTVKTDVQIVLGVPKGSLEPVTLELLAKAGFRARQQARVYTLCFDDPQVDGRLVKAKEMARHVEHGLIDCGLSGHDWVVESGAEVLEVCELEYSRASNRPSRWVLAVPEDSPVQSLEDLSGKRVATELIGVTRAFFEKRGVQAKIEFSWGATEAKVPELADAIVDLTETGRSLKANRLRVIDTVLETSIRLIANKTSWEVPEKREKIEQLALLLQASLQAQGKVGLKLNLPKDQLDNVLQVVPALRNPTISPLSDPNWVALESIIDESKARDMIPQLKALGGEGIIEYPLNKVIL